MIVLIIGILGATILCASYTSISFSDPGIVYDEGEDEEEAIGVDSDDEPYKKNQRITPSIYAPASTGAAHKIECGHCKIKRPISSTQ